MLRDPYAYMGSTTVHSVFLCSSILTSMSSYIKGSYVHRFLHSGVLTSKSSFLCPGVLTSMGVLTIIRGCYV